MMECDLIHLKFHTLTTAHSIYSVKLFSEMNGSYAHGKCQVQWVWDKQRDPLSGTVNFNFF